MVACLPGAALEEILDPDHVKGTLSVRLGPIAAAFSGEVVIQRDETQRVGTMNVEGIDKWTRTRVRSTISFAVAECKGATEVTLVSEISLMGTLAQVARKALLDRVAARLIEQFASALAARLESPPG